MDRILQSISLATKAGMSVSGEWAVEKALKDGKALLVIISEDASDNTKKHFNDMCTYRNVPIRYYSNMNDLGHCMGRSFRTSVGILDRGFAEKLLTALGR